MTLRRKMAYQIGGTIVALLLLAAASLWGLNGLRQDYRVALGWNQELREAYEVSSRVAAARMLLSLDVPEEGKAIVELGRAGALLELATPSAEGVAGDGQVRVELRARVEQAIEAIRVARRSHPGNDPAAVLAPLDALLVRSANLSADIRRRIEQRQHAADVRWKTTMAVMSVLALAAIAGAVVVGIAQYRGVVGPLGRLGRGVARLAEGRLDERIATDGPAEFGALAAEFNRMAGELDSLYRELEQKVEAKSRELVQSERLASVGYLAAGVAHEINNPIGIIAGYAEHSLEQMRAGRDPGAQDAMKVIADEAFRCKEIVGKLLALARSGSAGQGARREVRLAEVARGVVEVVSVLGHSRDRQIELDAPLPGPVVLGDEGELKQVVLNLVLNALDAVAEGGRVLIGVRADGEGVVLSVRDDGRGMTPEVRQHVFEPFFTTQRGAGKSGGTGLGLSISHAIVRAHGGTIEARSDGPGKGSEFVVSLPVRSPAGGMAGRV